MVLVSNRRPEERHEAVAAILVDRALEAMDSIGENPKEPIHDPMPFFGIHLLGEIHRPLHVGEEHGHLLALAFESGLRLQDLLGEMLWGVGPGIRRRY